MPKAVKIVFLSVIALFGLSFVLFHFGINFLSQKIDQPYEYIKSFLQQSTQDNPYSDKEKINFILLGLDERDDELEKTETTDTIIFASLNLTDNKLTLISLPRDLWDYNTNSKINDIYPQSLKQEDRFSYIKDKFNQITGQAVDNVIVLKTENLIRLIQLAGGLDVYLENGFIDTQYPNPEYIKDPKSGASKYITVEFDTGDVHLDETNVTQFVRSRKGGDTVAQGGTDLARIQRQQLVIDALLKKVKDGNLINSFTQIFDLYKFWNKDISKDITDLQTFQIGSIILNNISNGKDFTLEKKEITVGTNAKDGLIYHPATFINKQWVFIPADQEYKSFQQFFSDSI